MANTTATWTDRNSPPDVSAMSANDVKTITGRFVSRQSVTALLRAQVNLGQRFSVRAETGPDSIVVTRTA
jgi:hypothetical protein